MAEIAESTGSQTFEKARWRLLVVLEDGPRRTEAIDYWERDRLDAQLAAFEMQRGGPATRINGRPKMFAFSNRNGEVLAFAAERYISHEVVDLGELPS